VGDVDADPAAVEALGYLNGGAAAAEGSRTRSPRWNGLEDAFEEASVLGGVAEAFFGVRRERINIRNHILHDNTRSTSWYRLNRGIPPLEGQTINPARSS